MNDKESGTLQAFMGDRLPGRVLPLNRSFRDRGKCGSVYTAQIRDGRKMIDGL